jgi:hypothetical protein
LGRESLDYFLDFDLIVFSEFDSFALKFENRWVSLSVCPSVGWGPHSRENREDLIMFREFYDRDSDPIQ